jgi:uncharacterized membrane protein
VSSLPTEEPTLVEPRFLAVAAMASDPFLEERARSNAEVWHDRRSWVGPFYFGAGDTRLWTPKRNRDGTPHDSDRVINFRHPLGRKAFGVLMLGYLVGALAVLTLAALALGHRW